MRCEDFREIDPHASLSIVVGVHSHAPFEEFWKRMPIPKVAVMLPCCVEHKIEGLSPLDVFQDVDIVSKMNTIYAWQEL